MLTLEEWLVSPFVPLPWAGDPSVPQVSRCLLSAIYPSHATCSLERPSTPVAGGVVYTDHSQILAFRSLCIR